MRRNGAPTSSEDVDAEDEGLREPLGLCGCTSGTLCLPVQGFFMGGCLHGVNVLSPRGPSSLLAPPYMGQHRPMRIVRR